MNDTLDSANPRGCFVLLEHMLASSIALPIEMLKTAEARAKAEDRNAKSILVSTVAASTEPMNSRSGFKVQADATFADITSTDLVVVPALWRNPRPIIHRNPDLVDWLKQLHQQGASIIGAGTGCCFMAEAGILDGKPATTHWHYFDEFQRRYPSVQLKRQYFITQSGNLYCAGSVNSVADLMVHLIQRLYGRAIATHVQRNFSHEIRRSYESTSYYDDKRRYHPDEDIVQAQIWLQDNCEKEISLKAVAELFDMSVRNFNRRFKEATGKTPLQYLQEVRIDMAKDLLQTSNLSITEVAYRVGYHDMGHFSSLFKKFLATTPSDYRATVRAKLFTAET